MNTGCRVNNFFLCNSYSKPSKAAVSNSVTLTHTIESLQSLIELYEAWNTPEKANEWRGKLSQMVDIEE